MPRRKRKGFAAGTAYFLWGNRVVRRSCVAFVCAFTLATLLMPSRAAEPGFPWKRSRPEARLSQSKIGVHLIAHYTPGAKKIVAAGPAILKILDLNDEMRAALRDYKGAYPRGKTVLRVYTPTRYAITREPAACARDFSRATRERPDSPLGERRSVMRSGWPGLTARLAGTPMSSASRSSSAGTPPAGDRSTSRPLPAGSPAI